MLVRGPIVGFFLVAAGTTHFTWTDSGVPGHLTCQHSRVSSHLREGCINRDFAPKTIVLKAGIDIIFRECC